MLLLRISHKATIKVLVRDNAFISRLGSDLFPGSFSFVSRPSSLDYGGQRSPSVLCHVGFPIEQLTNMAMSFHQSQQTGGQEMSGKEEARVFL